MSQEFMDPELFSDFIVEAKEHLETIEPNLLELEKAPDNLGLLNEIFRPMHSLKGASGFLGLNRINHLAHKAENILDELRKGSMVLTPEIMDVILSATDALRQMIDNLETTSTEGDVPIEHIGDEIDAIMRGDTAAPAEAAPAPEPEADEPEPEEVPEAEEAPEVEDPTPEAASPVAEEGKPAPENAVNSGEEGDGLTQRDWIRTLPVGTPYALTAFGEGHLKDFIEESREITENLTSGLLSIEREENTDPELVNDLFRYFHNLKGNSGIIGFQELNSLTHEAETLLNRVRHNDMTASPELVDLLLLVVDVTDCLVDQINPTVGNVVPVEISPVLAQLQQAVAGGSIELPPALVAATHANEQKETSPAGKSETAAEETVTVYPVGAVDEDDLSAFQSTVQQQESIIAVALDTLAKDGSQKDRVDALYRSLVAVQNASGFMSFEEVKVYAERTAGLVNTARSSDMDFSMMVDLLRQEVSIIHDMIEKAVSQRKSGDSPAPVAKPAPPAPAPEKAKNGKAAKVAAPAKVEAPAPTAVAPATAPVQTSSPAPAKPAPVAKPETEAKPVAADKPEAAAAPAAAVRPPKIPAVPTPPAGSAPAAAARPPAGAPAEHKASSTIRVDHEKLDHLMNLIGELIINRNRYTMLARRLEDHGAAVDIGLIAQDLSETTYAMARISDDLQDTIMKVRMVPVASVFSRFPRLVRDLSRKSGKEVDLVLEGEETELDKSVVEVIGDPLVHLIRNAVDHGVESESERLAKGKSPKGRVVLRAFHKGNSVAIEIEDDGKGLDPDKLREVAVRKGLMTQEEAKQLDDREAKELIFAPGFSSAEKITDISGRGVGMDVVRTNIKNLKGSINISSEVGKGTKFTLNLPLTLAIIDALMINVEGEMYAIPLDAVSETTKIESSRLTDVKGRKAVTLRGEVLGIMELSEMLGFPHRDLPDVLSLVVIHDNDRRLGLVVDRLLERQEIVIKPLGSYLGDVRGISGATIMGDGSVILILDPHEIYTMATSNKGVGSSS